MKSQKKVRVVTIGGGNGQARLLAGLRWYKALSLTGVCPVTDSGTSTGKMRAEYGVSGATGDITKCMLALSGNEALTETLSKRFPSGSLAGHSGKNLLFSLLQLNYPLPKALNLMHEICGLNGHRVLPVSLESSTLHAKCKHASQTIKGETNLDILSQNPLWNSDFHSIEKVWISPSVAIFSEVYQALLAADHIVICPGDLYTSILPVILVRGTRQVLQKSRAQITVLVNIMTKAGETDGYEAEDFVRRIESRIGRKANFVVCNNAPIPHRLLTKYRLEHKVAMTPQVHNHKRILVASNIWSEDQGKICHDSGKTAEVLAKQVFGL
jgi:uncharacterized cofD-like protein